MPSSVSSGAKRPLLGAVLVIAIVAILTVSHMFRSGPDSQPSSSIHLYIGFDTSKSARPLLSGFVVAGAGLATELDPDRDRISFYRVDWEAAEFASGPAPESRETIQQTITDAVKPEPHQKGTRLARFWAQVAARSKDSTQPVIVLLYTDGDIDDASPTAIKELRDAIAQIDKNPHIRFVAAVGVRPEARAFLRGLFSPLRKRFDILDAGQANLSVLMKAANISR